MKPACSCSSCGSVNTSLGISNRPGLSALQYRIGTYDSFFAAMKARLSSQDFSFPSAAPPLLSLKTRDEDDPAIAMLDAWAVLADVLTFYQERIANEGYLRTATERQSIVALSALVGAALRPGVAASTYVAYTVDPTTGSTIAAGSKVQSIPGPGEMPQTFETSADLSGSGVISVIAPRLTRPQLLSSDSTTIYLSGMNNNIQPNDPILISGGAAPVPRVATVSLDAPSNRTIITLQPITNPSSAIQQRALAVAPSAPVDSQQAVSQTLNAMVSLVPSLQKSPASHPQTALDLLRRASDVYKPGLDTAPKIVSALNPGIEDELYPALARASVAPPASSQAFAFRVKAPVYGNNAQMKPITNAQGIVIGTEEWPLAGSDSVLMTIALKDAEGMSGLLRMHESANREESAIKITQGNSSAVGPLVNSGKAELIGKWSVEVDGSLANKKMTVSITPLGRTYQITEDASGAYTIVADKAKVSASAGQSVSTDSDGRHLVLTVGATSLVISDDAPSPLPVDQLSVIYMDSVYDKIVPDSYVYIERADNPEQSIVAKVKSVAQLSRNSYNTPARVSQLTLDTVWLTKDDLSLGVARNTTVYAQSDVLPLAQEPIPDDIAGDTIETGALYSDLQPGRWMIVSGERTDILGVTGIQGNELVMLASVKQGVQQIPLPQQAPSPTNALSSGPPSGDGATASAAPSSASPSDSYTSSAPGSGAPPTPPATQNRPGETTHSFLQLASPLAYTYKIDTVKVYGNVVQATHGETRKEVIGSGDSSQAFQQFKLHGSPLTYTSAASQSGASSSLAVYVNGILWKETDSLATCGPSDRSFVTSVDNQDVVTITFGDGQHGMRLPTGVENVQATYRIGIGSAGNLDSGKLSLLSTKPLGAKAVVNPVIASGGADRDSADAGRLNAPLASIALDRLVSVSDYASFARTFAGIGKATSAWLPAGHRRTVVVSVTGSEGTVVASDSQLIQQLTLALHQLGDPYLPIQVLTTDPLLLVINARIKTLPDAPWTTVAPMVQAALLSRFSFETQVPGASVYLSSVISTIQQVPGVEYALIDGFDTISRSEVSSAAEFQKKLSQLAMPARVPAIIPLKLEHLSKSGTIQPSEIAFLTPDLPDTILLTEIPS